jgi:hypothetical protein
MAAEKGTVKRSEAMGFLGISRDIGLCTLGTLLNDGASGVVACMPVDWMKFSQVVGSGASAIVSNVAVYSVPSDIGSGDEGRGSLLAELKALGTRMERVQSLEELIMGVVQEVSGGLEGLTPETSLMES